MPQAHSLGPSIVTHCAKKFRNSQGLTAPVQRDVAWALSLATLCAPLSDLAVFLEPCFVARP
jgi:hypothetical protein